MQRLARAGEREVESAIARRDGARRGMNEVLTEPVILEEVAIEGTRCNGTCVVRNNTPLSRARERGWGRGC